MGINRIATNVTSLSAQRNVNQTGLNLQRSIERLSSGLRINRAGDDAAGLTVANRLRTQSQGLNVAIANAQDGINVISVAEGALDETTNRLSRIRELALQAANTGVNDFGARSALQDEVFQSIDEITRIANTTLFSNNFLLKGDFSITSELKNGVQNVGANLDVSPVASNLGNGTAFLNIRQMKDGFKQITAGEAAGAQQILNTGITNQSDVAVSLALFTEGAVGLQSTAATGLNATGDNLQDVSFFSGVSLARTDIFTFTGVLSDGVTAFNGAISVNHVGTSITFGAFVSAVGTAIADAEAALFGGTSNVPSEFRTIASAATSGSNQGRILLRSSQTAFSEATLNISLVNANGDIKTSSNGVARAQEIGNQSALAGQGQVGNLVTAITGSTFADGEFDIQVEDVQSAQQRIVENSLIFRDGNGAILDKTTSLTTSGNSNTMLLNGTFVSGVFTGGTTLRTGDTVDFTGTTSDGNTFQSTFTFNPVPGAGDFDTDLNDFTFSSISGLVSELNFRTRDYDATATGATDGIQTRFENALFTFTAGGQVQLIDDLGQTDSQSNFTLTFNFSSGGARTSNSTIQDDGNLIKEGFAESATFRIDGGEAIRAQAGDVVTLFGEESTAEGVPSPQVTLRVGSGFTTGVDNFENQRDLYAGKLNGGPEVTFQAGDQDVVFLSQTTGGEAAKFVTFDFDDVIDVTSTFTGSDPGFTVLISTVNKGLNFQIGSGADQNIKFSLGDLRSDNLGFGRDSGRTVSNIDITNLTGANEAIRIIDEALDQVNRTRSILGAATNRLESTVSNLTVASENLTASESRIRDADIAAETTRFTQNQVLLQAGVSVLAQANFQSQGFLQLLG
ncbi:MAG: flagellin [Candidatus Hinthialibacter antarcticus]|nr:flagellin [Candidatus Hinthialibacter antarcticus]